MEAETYKKQLLAITAPYLNRADLIQGPGGNTSIKNDSGKLFIKASGFRFEEMSLNEGISAVDMNEIPEFFFKAVSGKISDSETAMLDLIKSKILLQSNGKSYPKPSMETGFHILLDDVVVHTHSVWTNLVNCAENREQLMKEIQSNLPYQSSSLPFLTPGFMLSYNIGIAIRKKKLTHSPDLFFLANHGIIAQGKSSVDVEEKLNAADQAIQQYFGIGNQYPSTALVSEGPEIWLPASNFISEMIDLYNCKPAFFNAVLFPDQTVFFKDQISDSKADIRKINIGTGKVFYRAGQREARAIHETLTAYLFIYHQLSSLHLKPAFIQAHAIDYINSMDMEKYRKSLMSD